MNIAYDYTDNIETLKYAHIIEIIYIIHPSLDPRPPRISLKIQLPLE